MKTTNTHSIQTSLLAILTVVGLSTAALAEGYQSSDDRCWDRDEAYKVCVKENSSTMNLSQVDATCKAETASILKSRTAAVLSGCENGTMVALVGGEIPLE